MFERILCACLTAFLFSGCAGMKTMPAPVVARIAGATEVFHRNQILDLAAAESVDFDRMMDHASTADILFVGENHDNPEHHLLQAQILQAWLLRSDPSAMAMEFFQQDQQAVLDLYTLGDMTEEAFLQAIDWKKTWGYPYHFYRPLLVAAKHCRIRVLALNAPREIVRKVAREGLDALDDMERAQIPRDLDLDNSSHKAYVREVYETHDRADLKNFEFFYQAQIVWEETMAGNLAEFFRVHNQKLIVFTGNGHIVRKYGIPDRVRRRVPVSEVTILPFSLRGTVTLERDLADFLWLTGS